MEKALGDNHCSGDVHAAETAQHEVDDSIRLLVWPCLTKVLDRLCLTIYWIFLVIIVVVVFYGLSATDDAVIGRWYNYKLTFIVDLCYMFTYY